MKVKPTSLKLLTPTLKMERDSKLLSESDTTFHIQSDQPDYLQEGQPNNESNYEQPMKEATSHVEEESAHEERYAST